MKKISSIEAAIISKVGVRRIQVLCQQGRIKGAEMISGVWMVPDNFTVSAPPVRKGFKLANLRAPGEKNA